MFLDAMGKTCPIPVVMARKELDAGCTDLTVAVDNETAVQNLSRLAASRGMAAAVETAQGGFLVHMTGESRPAAAPESAPTPVPRGSGYAVFLARDHVGDGAPELGYNLMKMALYTLSQSDTPPACLLFMNGGVKLPAGEEGQVIESLQSLLEKGCEILVCGTCLNYFGLTEQLKVGIVSNMYDIAGRLMTASRVVTV